MCCSEGGSGSHSGGRCLGRGGAARARRPEAVCYVEGKVAFIFKGIRVPSQAALSIAGPRGPRKAEKNPRCQVNRLFAIHSLFSIYRLWILEIFL